MDQTEPKDVERALTERPGHVALDGWTTLRLTGKDRAAFLHNMCTNDVRGLPGGGGCEAFVTDVKGKIIAHVLVLAGADEHLLVAAADRAADLMAHLDRYIIREDVQLNDYSSFATWALIAGRGSAELICQLTEKPAVAFSAPWSHHFLQLVRTPVQLVRCDLPWPGGFLASCRRDFRDQLCKNLQRTGLPLCTIADWHALRIESGWPLEGVDFDGANLPQEVGRDAQAISFRKGCYLGQETIARIDALGHVNKRLATVRFGAGAAPEAGAELLAGGQPIGRATSIAWSPALGSTLGLAMLKRGFNDPGQRLACGDIQAEVVATPAVKQSAK